MARLVLLERCGDVAEAAALRSLLQAHGIPCVVQGEQHRSMLGMLGAYIEPRVLVDEADLASAREVVGAAALEPAEEGPLADGAVCAFHEGVTAVACARCGRFLCVHCAGDAAAPLCDACEEKLLPGPEERRRCRRFAGAVVLALLFGPPVVWMVAASLLP